MLTALLIKRTWQDHVLDAYINSYSPMMLTQLYSVMCNHDLVVISIKMCTGPLTCSLTPGRDDAYYLRTRAFRRTAGLEQLRALPLAPPSTNDINPTLLAWLCGLFYALFSAINASTFPALIWSFTRLPPGPRRIIHYSCNHRLVKFSSPVKDGGITWGVFTNIK